MEYNTYAPHSDLKQFVQCYWTLKGVKNDNSSIQRILPDGCMEMIFHLGDLYKQYLDNGKAIIQPRCFVFGQVTKPLDIEPTGHTNVFAVRFHPEMFWPFIAIPLSGLQNKAESLEKLFGLNGIQLEKDILDAKCVESRIEICENFLITRLTIPTSIDHVVKESVSMIMDLNGQLPISELSKGTNTHRRQLERKFSSIIGISPKQLAKIIRLKATIKMMQNDQFTSLTALAYDGGYYDQSHFIKDFKEFTGQSPRQFYSDNLKLSSLFYESY